MKTKTKRGSALLLTTILMFVILSMVVSLTYVTVMEQKMSQKTKSSVGAFYGAESGVEWALNKLANPVGSTPTISSTFGVQATNATPDGKMSCPFEGCEVYLLDKDGKVIPKTQFSVADSADFVKAVRSVGDQGGETQRAIEAAVASSNEIYRISCGHDNQTVPGEQMAYCCRTKVDNGDTDCKSYKGGSWAVYPKPWSASTPGKYDITCDHDTSIFVCCRADAISGATKCRSCDGAGCTWLDYPDPF